jgi:hypothetical protein
MSFQKPNMSTGPSSASYSEFLKDIYSSLRNLTAGLNLINQRLDKLTEQLQSFDSRLANQDQLAQNLTSRLDTLIQQTETQQIRQTTNGLSLLTELDNLGYQQVRPNAGLTELGTRTDKLLASTNVLSKLSFQLPEIPDLSDIITLKQSLTNIISTDQECNKPSTTTTGITTTNTEINLETQHLNQQLGTNFLILD